MRTLPRRRSDLPAEPMGRGTKAWAWLGLAIALVVFGVTAIVGTIVGAVAWTNTPHETARTTGTVIRAGHCGGRGQKDGRARFAIDDDTYTASAPCDAHVGDRIQVRYDPADPTHANDSHTKAAVWFVVAGGALVFLLSMARKAARLHRTPSLPRVSHRRVGGGPPQHSV